MSEASPLNPAGFPFAGSGSASTETVDDAHLGPLRYETISHNGQQMTVVRDTEGHLVFPSEVPPATRSPTSPDLANPLPLPLPRPDHHTRAQTQPRLHPPSKSQLPPGPDTHPRKAKSDPMSPSDAQPTGRASHTRDHRAFTLPSGMAKRTQTGFSLLNRAISGYEGANDFSSESSSSDDEEGGHGIGRASSGQYRRFHIGNEHYHTKGKISKRDGRLSISVHDMSNTGYLAKALGTAAKKLAPLKAGGDDTDEAGPRPSHISRLSSISTTAGPDTISCPKLNIVIMVIGSRGDAQPFLKVGKVLKEQYGHRVRIATHPAFRDFVEKDSGLEFFSVGGDPSELMAFMVKNPGMIPTLETVKAGDIGRRRAAMAEMFGGFWRACINATDDEKDTRNVKMMGEKDPFVADAIIANPPSFAHIHCAEALGIPLHLMFTFPYTPTQAFPHPLASIKKSNVDPGYTNFISYPLVEMMVWQGLGDLVNDFRVKTLGLDPVSTLWAPGATYRLHVPFTYLWSPGLVPKPADWGSEVDVSGFVFLDLASTFKPPAPLTKFLSSGDAPVYIGFGSIVVDDANSFTNMIFEAVKLAGVRALVSKGWGGLGGDSLDVPENIFLLDNTPHDWLFPKVSACVIHGGAGTTAIALKCGKPTMIVPFFGDQHFWGSMVGKVGAGPEPVPYKSLTAEKLAEGIKYCLTDEAKEAAGKIAKDIELEGDGAENACQAFHKNLTLSGKNSMRCSILSDKVATWLLKDTNLRLSPMAADLIVGEGYVSWKKLRLLRHNEWNDFEGPGEPVTGVAGSLMSTAGNIFGGIGGVPYRIAKSKQERKQRKDMKQKRSAKRRQEREEKKGQAKEESQHKEEGHEQERGQDKEAHHGREESLEENQKDGEENVDGKGRGEGKRQNGGPSTKHTTVSSGVQGTTSPTTDAVDHAAESQPDGTHDSKNDGEESTPQVKTTTTNAIHRQETWETASATEEESRAEEVVTEIGRGAFKSATAIARAPMDLSLALAQGFHNAPRLYGDDTVRRPTRVTGIKSGLRAARQEFVYGIYDGWTGLVRLPVRGARDGGVRGFVTGVGMGITGFVLKDIAALFGPVGYTLKGLVKQAERGRQPIKYIRRARIVQGQREMGMLSDQEKKARAEEALHGWKVMRALWDALELEEKKKGGLRAKMGARKRGARGLGAVFESVEVAEKALAALRNGEGLESVVGADKGRKVDDRGKSTAIAAKEKERHGEEAGSGGAATAKGSTKIVSDEELDEENSVEDGQKSPTNPFSPTRMEMEKNREVNQKTLERVNAAVGNNRIGGNGVSGNGKAVNGIKGNGRIDEAMNGAIGDGINGRF